MPRTIATRTIIAPIDKVFKTVADINQFSSALPYIVKVEFLSDIKYGVGSRFRETRLVNGKEVMTELSVTELIENERIRLVAQSHGTTWDSLITVQQEEGRTLLSMTTDAKTEKLIPKVISYMVGGKVKKAVERDIDGVKSYCEKKR
jgi:carbon monoxide dehydrogenase subunit G